jgi:hypothetical protein
MHQNLRTQDEPITPITASHTLLRDRDKNVVPHFDAIDRYRGCSLKYTASFFSACDISVIAATFHHTTTTTTTHLTNRHFVDDVLLTSIDHTDEA